MVKEEKKKRSRKMISFLFLSLHHPSHPESSVSLPSWEVAARGTADKLQHCSSDGGTTHAGCAQGARHTSTTRLLSVFAADPRLLSSSQAPSPASKLPHYNINKATSMWQIQRFVNFWLHNPRRTASRWFWCLQRPCWVSLIMQVADNLKLMTVGFRDGYYLVISNCKD